MTYGTIVKLVQSYGSHWGRVQPDGALKTIFFNQASLPEGTDFAALRESQRVEFDEEPDRANGTHAVRVVPGSYPETIAGDEPQIARSQSSQSLA